MEFSESSAPSEHAIRTDEDVEFKLIDEHFPAMVTEEPLKRATDDMTSELMGSYIFLGCHHHPPRPP